MTSKSKLNQAKERKVYILDVLNKNEPWTKRKIRGQEEYNKRHIVTEGYIINYSWFRGEKKNVGRI